MTNSPSGFDAAALDPRKIAGGDPLLKRLVGGGVSPILIGVAYSVGFQSVRAFVAWRAGHLRTVGTTTGFLDDPALYSNLPFAALLFAYYTWMPRGIVAVFRGLYANRVIGPRRVDNLREEPGFVEQMQVSFGRWWWPATSLALTLGATFILVLPRYLALGQSVAWTADELNLGFALLWIGMGLYCVLILLIYSALSIFWLSRLFRSSAIRVRPLYPDRAGGLSPLGNFALKLSYLIAFIGIMLVVTPITRNYVAVGTLQFRWTLEILVGLGIYLVAAPIVFFGPLSVAHRVMEDRKDQLLKQIARRFDTVWTSIQNGLSVGVDITGLGSSLRALTELEALYETAEKFPVWPFNVSNLARFGTSYVSPLVVAAVSTLLTELLS